MPVITTQLYIQSLWLSPNNGAFLQYHLTEGTGGSLILGCYFWLAPECAVVSRAWSPSGILPANLMAQDMPEAPCLAASWQCGKFSAMVCCLLPVEQLSHGLHLCLLHGHGGFGVSLPHCFFGFSLSDLGNPLLLSFLLVSNHTHFCAKLSLSYVVSASSWDPDYKALLPRLSVSSNKVLRRGHYH